MWSCNKAIATLFPYAVRLEQSGKPEMADAIFRLFGAHRGAGLRWPHIKTHITSFFDKSTPPSLNRVIILTLPYVGRDVYADPTTVVSSWIAAASAIPYSEVDKNMTQALLMVLSNDDMRPHIPVNICAWLTTRLSLQLKSWGRFHASQRPVVRHIRTLGDIEILKSYFLLVWSEWQPHQDDCLVEMEITIREDFNGIGMRDHRDDLINRLDFVRGELDRGLDHFRQYRPWVGPGFFQMEREKYGRLKDALLAADKIAMGTLTRELPKLTFSNWLTDPCERVQNPTRPFPVFCLSHVRSFISVLAPLRFVFPLTPLVRKKFGNISLPHFHPFQAMQPGFGVPEIVPVVSLDCSLFFCFSFACSDPFSL